MTNTQPTALGLSLPPLTRSTFRSTSTHQAAGTCTDCFTPLMVAGTLARPLWRCPDCGTVWLTNTAGASRERAPLSTDRGALWLVVTVASALLAVSTAVVGTQAITQLNDHGTRSSVQLVP